LIIIDRDKFEENNLNRQMMATEDNLGQSKVKAAAQRIGQVNAAIHVTVFHVSIDAINIKKMIGKTDIVIDGLDNIATRRVVANACRDLNIPFIHGAIAGFHGQMMTIFPGDKGLDALCSSSAMADQGGLEALMGNPSATPTAVAAWQVQEAVKVITGIGKPIRHRLMMLDFENGAVDEIHLA
jgi:molybdopterin/thiamine biosynthesis adenylyltransferase